jgi:hypothetical protein
MLRNPRYQHLYHVIDRKLAAQSPVIRPVAERAPVDGHRDESPVAGISPVDLDLGCDDSLVDDGRRHAGVADEGTPIGLATNTETKVSKQKIITVCLVVYLQHLDSR